MALKEGVGGSRWAAGWWSFVVFTERVGVLGGLLVGGALWC